MPVIAAQALRYGLVFPWYYEPHGARYRYRDRQIDLMDFLPDHGEGAFSRSIWPLGWWACPARSTAQVATWESSSFSY